MFWAQGFGGDGSVVPDKHTLEITNLTIDYFPKQTAGTLGRLDIAGRDAAGLGTGDAKWRLQTVYVEPKKTVHVTLPQALRLEAGGHVEIGFVEEGPGTIGQEPKRELAAVRASGPENKRGRDSGFRPCHSQIGT